VKIVQQDRYYLYLKYHEFLANPYGVSSDYVSYARSLTSERNFGTLVKVNCLCVLSEKCSTRTNLLTSQIS